jgi:hypothetical protein
MTWPREQQEQVDRGELVECVATMSDGTKRKFLMPTERYRGWRAYPVRKPGGYKGRWARDLPTPGELGMQIEIDLVEARIAERKAAPAASSSPVTRADYIVARMMAEGIQRPLAVEHLRLAIWQQAQRLIERQPWRFGAGSGFPDEGMARAQAAVAAWWRQPY